jgi:hypothetical protein
LTLEWRGLDIVPVTLFIRPAGWLVGVVPTRRSNNLRVLIPVRRDSGQVTTDNLGLNTGNYIGRTFPASRQDDRHRLDPRSAELDPLPVLAMTTAAYPAR